MITTITTVARDPVLYIGAAAAWTVERLNGYVGLLVGLATLVYLCLRIREAWRNRHARTRGSG